MKFQELKGACIASSVYAKGEQIGYNIPIKLPEVTPVIVEIQAAGGKLELPVWQQVEVMEASITKTGVSKEFLESLTPEPFDLISNVAQQSVSADGTSTAQHIKAFMRVIPKSAPGVEITAGEASENELPFTVLSYQLYVDGNKYLDIDVVKGVCWINGKDYSESIRSML